MTLFDELRSCVFGSWSPTIGDPTFMGWMTAFSYVAAALLSAFVLIRHSSHQRTFWFLLTVFLVLLSVNKQLDLQSALTAIGRCTAKIQGWYDQRRTVQVSFIIAFSALSLISSLVIAWSMRVGLSRNWLALFGFAFLVTFVVVRAAGFHNFDRFISFELGAIRINWLFELTGIAMISLNAIFLIMRGPGLKPQRKKRRSPESNLPYQRRHNNIRPPY